MLVDEDEQAPPPQRINVRVLTNSSLRLQEQKLTDCLDGSFCYAMHLRPVFTTMIVIIFTVLGCSFFVSLLAVVDICRLHAERWTCFSCAEMVLSWYVAVFCVPTFQASYLLYDFLFPYYSYPSLPIFALLRRLGHPILKGR